LVVSVAATLAIAAGGCSSEPDSSATGGASSSGGASSGGASSGGASTGGAATGGGPAAVSYAKDVQPILMAKCGPCHSVMGQGGHNLATTYADAKKPAESRQFDECWAGRDPMTGELTGPKTMGECASLLAAAGRMPASIGCDAPTPPDPSKCLTAAEKATLAAWVAGGLAP